jgi:hypothetical protein
LFVFNFFLVFSQESCIEFEKLVSEQCEALIVAIHSRREFLLDAIRMDKDSKIRILKVGGTCLVLKSAFLNRAVFVVEIYYF